MLSMLPTMTVKMTVLINPVLYIVLNSQVSKHTIIICVIILIVNSDVEWWRFNSSTFQFRAIFSTLILCYEHPTQAARQMSIKIRQKIAMIQEKSSNDESEIINRDLTHTYGTSCREMSRLQVDGQRHNLVDRRHYSFRSSREHHRRNKNSELRK